MAADTAVALDTRSAIIVVSGTQGAGKSTVSDLLARRFPRGVHISADMLQSMIVSGGEWPSAPSPNAESRDVGGEAASQLRLRLHNACLLARSFVAALFTAIIDDIVVGARLDDLLTELEGTAFAFVMLVPSLGAVRAREADRGTHLYEEWEWLDDEIRTKTRRVGLWIDSSEQTPAETVDEIMRRVRIEGIVSVENEQLKASV